MPATATRRRTRRQPIQSEALFCFCRHCGEEAQPGSSPIEGVCQRCTETLYVRCDNCETYHEIGSVESTTSNHDLCRECAESLTFVCDDCGCRHEHADHTHVHERHGRTICDQCATGYSTCDCCGQLFRNSDVQLTSDGRFCWACAAYSNGRPIQAYSFKPEPVFHDVEDGDSTLFLGAELEMDDGDAEAAAKRIRAMYGPKTLYIKHDGSLPDGCELVTHPMSPEFMMSTEGRKMWSDICDAAKAEGMRSHDTDTCGFHVHVSRDFFGKSGTSQELTELKLIETVDRLFEPFVIFSRRKRSKINQWATKCNAPKSDDDGWIRKAKRVSNYAKSDRYHAVNITNKSTIEFRLFRGTLKVETILATLQFISGFCYLAKSLNPSQMNRLSWYDLCDAVMESCPVDCTELYEYLVERELIVPKGEN